VALGVSPRLRGGMPPGGTVNAFIPGVQRPSEPLGVPPTMATGTKHLNFPDRSEEVDTPPANRPRGLTRVATVWEDL